MIRAFHHYFSSRKLALFLVETSAIAIASWIGAAVTALAAVPARGGLQVAEALPALATTALAFVATFQLAMYFSDLYDLRVATEDRSRGVRVLRAVGIAALMMGLTMMASRFNPPEGALLGGAAGAIFGIVLVRIGLRGVVGEPERILIVGNGKRARWLAKAAVEQGEFGFEVCGMIDPRRDSNDGSGDKRSTKSPPGSTLSTWYWLPRIRADRVGRKSFCAAGWPDEGFTTSPVFVSGCCVESRFCTCAPPISLSRTSCRSRTCEASPSEPATLWRRPRFWCWRLP